jgi:hypothetical protein
MILACEKRGSRTRVPVLVAGPAARPPSVPYP